MRASVKAAKSSAENRGRCVPASSGTSGGSAKIVEDRLAKPEVQWSLYQNMLYHKPLPLPNSYLVAPRFTTDHLLPPSAGRAALRGFGLRSRREPIEFVLLV